jgi:2-keto-4-pentenoate hydratase/2-oxohepta-3-ene-1,7-dioic acid hydratase in catechol pathway
MLDREGNLRDLSKVLFQIDDRTLAPEELAKLRKIDPESLPKVKGAPRLGVPYAGISKFVAVGLNYSDHAAESGMAIPSEPILFMKATTSLCGPNDDIIQPKGSTKLDWEVELGIVIGTKAQYVPESKALDYVAGYCVINDVSERNFQLERGSQWDRGKGCDTFGPVGPWLVTTDEITDPQTLDMWLDVNGEKRQRGSTRTMIFGCAHLVSYISQFMTLLPGDIITTGTPPGVGLGMKPPKYLNPGDVVTLGIQGLGEQRQRVVAYSGN